VFVRHSNIISKIFNKVLSCLEHVRLYVPVTREKCELIWFFTRAHLLLRARRILLADLIRCDGFAWLHAQWKRASDGYERQLRTENEYTNTRLFSFFSRASPVHDPVKYNLWLNERTLLVKQIQLRADINDPICTPRGEYFAIIRSLPKYVNEMAESEFRA